MASTYSGELQHTSLECVTVLLEGYNRREGEGDVTRGHFRGQQATQLSYKATKRNVG